MVTTAHQSDNSILYTLGIGVSVNAHISIAKVYGLRFRETNLLCTIHYLSQNDQWIYMSKIREFAGMDKIPRNRILFAGLMESLVEKNMVEQKVEHKKHILYRLSRLGKNALMHYQENINKVLKAP
ncbi:hypothetical protein QNI16_23550 [Cytophagaceae bacterium YF14B1]|uniref:Uncharacterized protein n=1 Tax=Xanthocytophaga flava TaxID=3048013 RepID=A0AAE3U804_9BACT|nr:hypothetical protein [Xanthocytophaga flavus]MDJ1483494.1 hypothetical protein [Xanthocytophaga flavus]